ALVAASGLPIDAIAGHSFGGKVVMATRALVAPAQTWILDASPSPRAGAIDDVDNSVTGVLVLMERLPATFARREDFVAAVVAGGFDAGLAAWLAMNVVAGDDGRYRQRLDLVAIRAMLADYWARDLWSAIEAGPGDVEFVIADHSPAVSPADRARLATAGPHVHVHLLDADHWLHIQAPAAVVELFAARLP
ncbi:MAG: alpha/beta fold hydrolase, partial [Proteobacteria bacterium]|nr:alpha/beta fold hydrolase [Pseudomonadota bacterium]